MRRYTAVSVTTAVLYCLFVWPFRYTGSYSLQVRYRPSLSTFPIMGGWLTARPRDDACCVVVQLLIMVRTIRAHHGPCCRRAVPSAVRARS